jgi:hypothetical protein
MALLVYTEYGHSTIENQDGFCTGSMMLIILLQDKWSGRANIGLEDRDRRREEVGAAFGDHKFGWEARASPLRRRVHSPCRTCLAVFLADDYQKKVDMSRLAVSEEKTYSGQSLG